MDLLLSLSVTRSDHGFESISTHVLLPDAARSWAAVSATARTPVLAFEDDEGDAITVSSQGEWDEALRFAVVVEGARVLCCAAPPPRAAAASATPAPELAPAGQQMPLTLVLGGGGGAVALTAAEAGSFPAVLKALDCAAGDAVVWLDDEGDEITSSSSAEWLEALSFAQPVGGTHRTLGVRVVRAAPAAHARSAPPPYECTRMASPPRDFSAIGCSAIMYVDEDGDEIVCSSQIEYEEALRCADADGGLCFRCVGAATATEANPWLAKLKAACPHMSQGEFRDLQSLLNDPDFRGDVQLVDARGATLADVLNWLHPEGYVGNAAASWDAATGTLSVSAGQLQDRLPFVAGAARGTLTATGAAYLSSGTVAIAPSHGEMLRLKALQLPAKAKRVKVQLASGGSRTLVAATAKAVPGDDLLITFADELNLTHLQELSVMLQ